MRACINTRGTHVYKHAYETTRVNLKIGFRYEGTMYRQQLEHIDRISAKPADDDEHAQMELFNPNEYKANRQVPASAGGTVAHVITLVLNIVQTNLDHMHDRLSAFR